MSPTPRPPCRRDRIAVVRANGLCARVLCLQHSHMCSSVALFAKLSGSQIVLSPGETRVADTWHIHLDRC
jgi:hypothetical protein